jgi:hypothetical protein
MPIISALHSKFVLKGEYFAEGEIKMMGSCYYSVNEAF